MNHRTVRFVLVITVLACVLTTTASAWKLFTNPFRRFFSGDIPMEIVVDQRGIPSIELPDHGVGDAIGAVLEWNDLLPSDLVTSHAGVIRQNLCDGISEVVFSGEQSCYGPCEDDCIAQTCWTFYEPPDRKCFDVKPTNPGVEKMTRLLEANVYVNPNNPKGRPWVTRTTGCSGNGRFLEFAVKHEIGHVLGLAHSGVDPSVMRVEDLDCSDMVLQQDDLDGRDAIYTAPQTFCPPEFDCSNPNLPPLRVQFPFGGEQLIIGSTVNLTWQACDELTMFDVQVLRTGLLDENIVQGFPGKTFPWTVVGPPSNQAKLKVTGHAIDEPGQPVVSETAVSEGDFLIVFDVDGDGLPDSCDNCPALSNPGQPDQDEDGVGDGCDNCPLISNTNQENCNGDGEGDVCEAATVDRDDDGDGVCNGSDNCPSDANASQADLDTDQVGDACDNCPLNSNPNQEDCDGDGEGDVCESATADQDDDGDGVCNGSDNCPSDANAGQADLDTDQIGDACDNCPGAWNPGQQDADGDGRGDACEGRRIRRCQAYCQAEEIGCVQIYTGPGGCCAYECGPNPICEGPDPIPFNACR